MDPKFRLREQLVGLFLVVTLILSVGAVIVVARGKNWFSKQNIYYTTFKEGYGLKEGSTVKMFNAEIGRVRTISINDENEVEVSMAILAEYERKLRQDSVATVESPTLIGSEYISISPGSREAAQIPPGGSINSMPRKSIGSYMDEFGLKEKFAQVGQVLDTLTEVASDVKAMTADVRAGKGNLGKLLVEDDLYVKLDRLSGELERTAANLDELTTSMKPAAAELATLTRELSATVKEARSGIRNFKRGSEDFPALVTNTDEAVKQFRRVVESAKTLPLLRSNLPPDTRRDQVELDPRGM